MSLGVHLERFPPDILSHITSHLPALNVYQLAICTGSRTLQRKFFNGGVTTITLKELSLRRLGLKFLNDLKGLRRASLHCSFYSDPLDLFDLPSNLSELCIVGYCSIWMGEKGGRKIFGSAPINAANLHLYRNGGSIFPFKHLLPNLRSLDLFCESQTCPPVTQELVAHALPPCLTCLRLSHLEEASPAVIMASLPNLSRVSCQSRCVVSIFRDLGFREARKPRELPSLKLLAQALPSVMVDHLNITIPLPMPSQLPYIPKNAELVTIDLVPSVLALQEKLSSDILLSLATLFPNPNDTTPSNEHLPGLPLLSLTTRSMGFSDSDMKNKDSIVWPASLQELTLLNLRQPYADYSALPQRLKCLAMTGFLTKACVMSLPTSLTKLDFNVASTNHHIIFPSALSLLPQSLTHLRIDNFSVEPFVHLLPRGLKTLNAYSVSSADERFWTGLPPGLTELSCFHQSVLHDTHIHLMPPSLTKIHFPTVELSGAYYATSSHYANVKKLHISYRANITRRLDGAVLLCSGEMAWNETTLSASPLRLSSIQPKIATLPSSLTHLIWEIEPRPPKALTLPHLTRLEINDLSSFNWLSTLPSLTHLVLLNASNWKPPHSVNASPSPPPNLTRLTVKNCQYDDTFIPSLFRSKILIFEEHVPRHSYNVPWKELPNVTSLSYAQSTSSSRPRHSLPSAATLFVNLASLRHLSVKDVNWCVSEEDMETIQKRRPNATLECASISISSLESYGSVLGTSGDSLSFGHAAGQMAMSKFSFLKLLDGYTVRIAKLTSLDTSALLASAGSNTLTTLTVTQHIHLPHNFGRLLPRTISSLNVIAASGIHCGTPRTLPESLKVLHINSVTFTSDVYRDLPRGLETLILQNGKLRARHASALPPNLLNLSVSMERCGRDGIANLPRTITGLELDELSSGQIFHKGIPPNLRVLIVRCYSTHVNDQFDSLLPKTITTYIKEVCSLEPTSLLLSIPSLFDKSLPTEGNNSTIEDL